MVKIEWSPTAQHDLTDIIDYIAQDSLEYALIFYEEVREKVQNLIQFPKIGRKIPELDDSAIRELILKSYRIIYRVHMEKIEIIRIIHGSKILKF
ncbi:MAG: type II toxin-antitoxin system RelE/ParE family toxin [Candidatus Lokiarchaeota archaeon]|nr:type II toxin-antitoxin system RelE/ParE family toxin [Candidatus Lokiarchaeota archaeon]